MQLSVVWATRNEEQNIARSIESVKSIANEMIVVDEHSTDETREVAEKLGAKVYLEDHHDIFHITKQKALDLAKGEWILQLDADEVVTSELAKQIQEVVNGSYKYVPNRLFKRHQFLVEQRDGAIGKKTGEVVGYFIPRRNMFLGKPLTHAGVYPDGVIRLVKNGKAAFPQKSVHEQIQLASEVSWLSADLLHYDSPTLRRYLTRLNRYTDLIAQDYKGDNLSKSFFTFIKYVIIKPKITFLSLYFRHKGFLDGVPGFLWSFFSASRFAISYFKYITNKG